MRHGAFDEIKKRVKNRVFRFSFFDLSRQLQRFVYCAFVVWNANVLLSNAGQNGKETGIHTSLMEMSGVNYHVFYYIIVIVQPVEMRLK